MRRGVVCIMMKSDGSRSTNCGVVLLLKEDVKKKKNLGGRRAFVVEDAGG